MNTAFLFSILPSYRLIMSVHSHRIIVIGIQTVLNAACARFINEGCSTPGFDCRRNGLPAGR